MSSWFNAPKDGSKFGSISLDEQAKVVFSEAIIKDSENYVQISGFIESCTGVVDLQNKDKNPLPCLATVRINKQNWKTSYNGKDKEYVATPASKFFAKKWLEFGIDKPVKGHFDLSCPDAMVAALETGSYEGQVLAPLQVQMMLDSYFKAESTELTRFKLEDVPTPQAGNSFQRKGGQSEKQRILDRFEAMKELLGAGFSDCKDLIELDALLTELCADSGLTYAHVLDLVRLLIV